MSDEERHNELSVRFDELTVILKSMTSEDPRYKKTWNDRANIREEMNALSRRITG